MLVWKEGVFRCCPSSLHGLGREISLALLVLAKFREKLRRFRFCVSEFFVSGNFQDSVLGLPKANILELRDL